MGNQSRTGHGQQFANQYKQFLLTDGWMLCFGSLEIRKQMLENHHKLGIQKFANFSGQSTTAITTVNAPSVVKIKPRSVEAMQLGDLTRFAKYVSHNGAGIQINQIFNIDIDIAIF